MARSFYEDKHGDALMQERTKAQEIQYKLYRIAL